MRAGSAEEESYRSDAGLSEAGNAYAIKMTETLLKHREQERRSAVEAGGPNIPLKPLTVWTSTRLRTVQTAIPLQEQGYKVRQRSQMSALNPGVCEKLSERAIRALYPDEVEKHELDPYHHRYPRAEVSQSIWYHVVRKHHLTVWLFFSVLPRSCCPIGAYHSRTRA